MEKVAPLRLYRNILNSLGGGTVPREGLAYIAVGREQELKALLRDTEILQEEGSTFRILVGDYGSGKTFLLQTLKEYAVKRGFVVAEADLSPDRNLVGSSQNKRGLGTYRELMANVSNKSNQTGHALEKILDVWTGNLFEIAAQEIVHIPGGVSNMESYTESVLKKQCANIASMTHGYEFSKALDLYWKASRISDEEKSEEMKENVMRWLRGDYATNQEAKSILGINAIINDENWFDFIKIWSLFFKMAGYKGFIILIDELVNVYNLSKNMRQKNYEKILSMYNDCLQGRVNGLGIIMGGIPKSVYEKERGMFSYEALRSRLSTGVYQDNSVINMMTPIIKVKPLTKEEMFVLLEKLSDLHSEVYSYSKVITNEEMLDFIKIAYMKRETLNGAEKTITPRTMIRDYIQVLDVKRQNPEKKVKDLLLGYTFALDEGETYVEEQ